MDTYPARLREFLEENIHESSFWMSGIIRYFSEDKNRVISLLEGLLETEESVRQIATNSYGHLNGFDKIVLSTFGRPECKLRLHVWWGNGGKRAYENVHNHRWNFAAAIVIGRYRFQSYETGRGEEFYEYSYRSPDDNDHYVMDFSRPVHARCTMDAQFCSGTHYELSHSALHRVSVLLDETVVSLVCQGAPVKAATRVLSDRKIPNASRIQVKRMTPSEVKTKLEAVISVLQ